MGDHQYIRLINAQLRYYMHIANPEDLSDEEWSARWQELIWIRKKEAESREQ